MSEPGFSGPVLAFSRESVFSFENFHDIGISSRPMLVKGILPTRGVAFMVGASKSGKTFVSIDTGLRLASGAPKIFGRRARQCAVVYIGAEDPDGCRARILAWKKHRNRVSPTPFEFIGRGVNILDPDEMADLETTLLQHKAALDDEGQRLGVVFFDTLSRCIPGIDENSSQDMSRAFAALEALGRALDCLIVVVAHYGKGGSDKGIRGWSGMDAASDATISVERDGELRTITFTKVKNGQDGGQLNFILDEVGLGIIDDDGDEVTSCIIKYAGAGEAGVGGATAARKRHKPLTASEAVVFNSIRRLTDKGNHVPIPVTDGVSPHHRGLRRDDVRSDSFQTGFMADGDKPNTVTKRFGRTLEALIAKEKIRVHGDVVWLL